MFSNNKTQRFSDFIIGGTHHAPLIGVHSNSKDIYLPKKTHIRNTHPKINAYENRM